MTDSCSYITVYLSEKYAYKYAHSGGAVVASTEVKIIRADRSEAEVVESREVLVHRPRVVMGYLNNTATREIFNQRGWLHTRDQGFVDSEGMMYIQDRLKKMIKVKCINTNPAGLKNLLSRHEKVGDVAIMNVVSAEYAEEVTKAYVMLKPGVTPNTAAGEEPWSSVKGMKVRYKWNKEVEFVDRMPKSVSGSILMRVLRDTRRETSGEKSFVVRDQVKAKL
jgi:4-coumarate--CoA ligase